MATCAICQRPIAGHQRFVITNEAEALHTACARAGATTVGQRLRMALAAAQTELASARVVAARAALDREQLAVDHRAREAEWTARLAEAKRETQTAAAERDAARRELALMQAIRGSPPAQSGTEGAPPDERDPAVVRYSLLELT